MLSHIVQETHLILISVFHLVFVFSCWYFSSVPNLDNLNVVHFLGPDI